MHTGTRVIIDYAKKSIGIKGKAFYLRWGQFYWSRLTFNLNFLQT